MNSDNFVNTMNYIKPVSTKKKTTTHTHTLALQTNSTSKLNICRILNNIRSVLSLIGGVYVQKSSLAAGLLQVNTLAGHDSFTN